MILSDTKNESKKLSELKKQIEYFNNSLANLKVKRLVWLSMNEKELLSNQLIQDGGDTFLIIKDTLMLACVIDIAGLSKDDDLRALSIVNIMKLIKSPAIKNELLHNLNQYKPSIEWGGGVVSQAYKDSIYEDEKAKIIAVFNNSYDDLITLNKDKKIQVKLNSFKEFRNKIAAHTDIYDNNGVMRRLNTESLNLVWDDFDEAIEYLEKMNGLLHMVILSQSVSWEFFNDHSIESTIKFWQPYHNPYPDPSG